MTPGRRNVLWAAIGLALGLGSLPAFADECDEADQRYETASSEEKAFRAQADEKIFATSPHDWTAANCEELVPLLRQLISMIQGLDKLDSEVSEACLGSPDDSVSPMIEYYQNDLKRCEGIIATGPVTPSVEAKSAPATQTQSCPCEHKAPGQTYVTSSAPISEAHAKCLEPVDKYLVWLNEQVGTLDESSMERMLMGGMFQAVVAMDHGVPARTEAEKDLAASKKDFMETAATAGEMSAQADLAQKRIEGTKGPAPIEPGDVSALARSFGDFAGKQIAAIRASQKLTTEEALQRNAAFIAFNQCVIDNDLPATR